MNSWRNPALAQPSRIQDTVTGAAAEPTIGGGALATVFAAEEEAPFAAAAAVLAPEGSTG